MEKFLPIKNGDDRIRMGVEIRADIDAYVPIDYKMQAKSIFEAIFQHC